MPRRESNTATLNRKGLPASVETEKFVLGSILLDGTKYATVTGAVSRETFSLSRHQLIWDAISALAERGTVIDRATVANELATTNNLGNAGGLAYLIDLDEGLPNIENVNSYVAIIVEKFRLRKALYAAQQTITQVMSGEYTADEVSLNGQAMLADNVGGFGSTQIESVREFVENFPGGINLLLDPSREDAGIPTGLREFDEITGGFHATEIFLIGARPSHGKTCMASCIAKTVARGGNAVAMFSLELSKKMLLQRMISEESYVSFFRFREGQLDDEDRRRVREGTNIVMDMPLFIDDTSGLRVADIRVRLNKILRNQPVRLIIIDYAQLIRPPKGVRFGTENDKFTLIGEELKALTKDTGIPLLLMSQLNRDSEKDKGDNRPKLAQCRGAGIWEEISFVGSTLYREYLRKRDRADLRDVAQLLVEKNRSGETRVIDLRFTSWLMRFGNQEPPNQA